ncbi:MAG: Ig-like domain-containing protein [Gracilimonas sp.]|nr:Ig-like domain-containing protein [Gracilimonas sp.]
MGVSKHLFSGYVLKVINFITGDFTLLGTVIITILFTLHNNFTAPVANDDTYTMRPNTTLSVDAESGLLANDSDPDGDPIRAILIGSAENGSINVVTDGSFTYTPDEDFVGVDSMTVYHQRWA